VREKIFEPSCCDDCPLYTEDWPKNQYSGDFNCGLYGSGDFKESPKRMAFFARGGDGSYKRKLCKVVRIVICLEEEEG